MPEKGIPVPVLQSVVNVESSVVDPDSITAQTGYQFYLVKGSLYFFGSHVHFREGNGTGNGGKFRVAAVIKDGAVTGLAKRIGAGGLAVYLEPQPAVVRKAVVNLCCIIAEGYSWIRTGQVLLGTIFHYGTLGSVPAGIFRFLGFFTGCEEKENHDHGKRWQVCFHLGLYLRVQ